jgi:hypothetical protein
LEDSNELKEVYHQILIEKNTEASDIFRDTKLKLWDIQRDKHIEESLFMGLKLYLQHSYEFTTDRTDLDANLV